MRPLLLLTDADRFPLAAPMCAAAEAAGARLVELPGPDRIAAAVQRVTLLSTLAL